MSTIDIRNLPPEIWVMIMIHCGSPHDVFSLIKASPQILACFVSNRRRIVKPYVDELEASVGGYIPKYAVLAARLRLAREEGLCKLSAREAEQTIIPVLLSHLARQDQAAPLPLSTKLSVICALSTLAGESAWVISNYATEAWQNMTFYCQEIRPFMRKDNKQARNDLELSVEEKKKFYNALFRFEGYCQAFFQHQEILFKGDEYSRELFFRVRNSVEHVDVLIEDFYSIVYYIYDQHWSMLYNVVRHLGSTSTAPYNIDEEVAANKIRAQASSVPLVRVQSDLYLCRFQYRTWIQLHKYIHYLTSQGLGMLLRLQRMSIEDQTAFTLASFFDVSLSHHPVVFMVDGIDGHRKGILGDNLWMPWVYSQLEDFRDPDGWKCAYSFWDEDRKIGSCPRMKSVPV
ncbi:hypothetical protein NM208_g10688 [Fusarium decemcellulare]|uniref:Uncharacterized protein n=1 Tax=Fusarium decemcellulare TaxID=57161 RepID=A0ACC1RWZ6_9HYPO|nr:hypothetical protein NM208_g10688 [Fusarium decemcellulare]